jgi:FkbM family methyltransferase
VECINVMVGKENGLSILHESSEHIGKGDVALLSTAVPAEMDRWKNTDTVFTPTEMYCVDFDRLMTLANHQTFDLISIDIEGHDLSVLRQMDLDALACRMLIVEWNSKDKEQFDNYVLPFGFRLYSKNAENLIYVR